MHAIVSIIFLCASAANLMAAADVLSDPDQDFAQSDMVVAGRVVGIECIPEADDAAQKRNEAYYAYYATMRVCRSFKGTYGAGKEARIYIGGYWAKREGGDVSLETLHRNGSRHLLFEVGGVYVVFLNTMEPASGLKEAWRPRSQQASIIPIIQDQSVFGVATKDEHFVPLDVYMAGRKGAP